MLSSLFAGGGTVGPEIKEFRDSRFSKGRTSRPRGIYKYWLDPNEVAEYTEKRFHELDRQIETRYIHNLQLDCQNELIRQNRIIQDAQGLFFTDHNQIARARKMKMPACSKLKEHGLRTE